MLLLLEGARFNGACSEASSRFHPYNSRRKKESGSCSMAMLDTTLDAGVIGKYDAIEGELPVLCHCRSDHDDVAATGLSCLPVNWLSIGPAELESVSGSVCGTTPTEQTASLHCATFRGF